MSDEFRQELETGISAVRAAARLCRHVQAAITPDILEKKDRSPVTVADYGSQAVICKKIGDIFQDDPIIGEEDAAALRRSENKPFLDQVACELANIQAGGSDEEICEWIDRGGASEYSDRFWTLDPIDGTKGFLRGEQFAISLALLVNGEIQVALLGCPNLPVDGEADDGIGVVFHAVRGQGCWMAPLNEDASEFTVRVSSVDDPRQARFCESVETAHSSHSLSARVAEQMGIGREPLRMDSQAKYAVVARGDAEIYMRLPARRDYREKIWDHAGGVLLVEEAGGHVTDVMGNPLEFTHGHELSANRGVIASNRHLHGRVLSTLERNYKRAD